MKYFKLFLQLATLIPLRLFFIILGFFIVPVALLFRKTDESTKTPFTQYEGNWVFVTLPDWAWCWSNDRDGAIGDKRGWWNENAPFGLGAYHFFSMYWWLAFRNPANNLRFTKLFGCPVVDCTFVYDGDKYVKDKYGMDGKRFIIATHKETDRKYYGFYMVKTYNEKRALVIQLGFKCQPSNWEEDYSEDPTKGWKGFTFEVNPYKDIE